MSFYFTTTELNDIGRALSHTNKAMLFTMLNFCFIMFTIHTTFSKWKVFDTHSNHTDVCYYNLSNQMH